MAELGAIFKLDLEARWGERVKAFESMLERRDNPMADKLPSAEYEGANGERYERNRFAPNPFCFFLFFFSLFLRSPSSVIRGHGDTGL